MSTPISPAEVAAIMEGILDVTGITADDNFYDIGGNSFLALELIEVLKRKFGVSITVLELVRAPTPSEIADIGNADADARVGT